MERFRQFNSRRLSVFLFLTIILISYSFLPVLAGALSEHNPSFVDGHWQGSYTMIGTLLFDGPGTGKIVFTGNLDFLSGAGDVGGSFNLDGISDFTMQGGKGQGLYTGEGEIFGRSNALQMQLTRTKIDIKVDVIGKVYEETVTLGSGDSQPLKILLISATCSQAVGDIETPAIASFEGAGGKVQILTGSFNATRIEDLAAEVKPNYYELSAELLYDAVEFTKQTQESGEIDFFELSDLLERAENLTRAIKRNNECGLIDDPIKFLSPISMTVANLLSFVINNADSFDTSEIGEIVIIALRTGAIGAGAVDTQTAEKLKQSLIDLILERATAAEAKAQEGFHNKVPSNINEGCTELAATFPIFTLLGEDHLISTFRFENFCMGWGGG